MAEGIFRRMAEEAGRKDLYCMSAGLAAADGAPAAEKAFDVFAVMTATHAYVLRQAGVPEHKIYILGEEIADPYGGDLATYRACREQLTAALRELLARCRTGLEKTDEA